MTEPHYINLYNEPSKIDWAYPVVIDFESYYDKDWSLKKVTTEKYIRGDSWECIGVSIKVGDVETKFYRGETGIPIIAALVKYLPNSPFVSHNNSFDMGVLGLRYNIHPNFMVDTAIMAQLCGLDRVAGGTSLAKVTDYLEKLGVVNKVKGDTVYNMVGVHRDDMTEAQWVEYGAYCVLDTDLCYSLYKYMIEKVPTMELIMADITTKMWTKPVVDLDAPLLKNYAVQLYIDRENALSRVSSSLGFDNNKEFLSALRSSKKFVEQLRRLNVDVPMKWSEKTQQMIPAVSKTDLEFLALLDHEDELVRSLVETKLGAMSSMEQTRTATFLDISQRGLMPIPLRYGAAHTGRYGGCFVADTKVLCLTSDQRVLEKNIIDVLLSDRVWDGEEWCTHSGVEFNGYQEVITYDGLTGTQNHRVFIDEETETTLLDAMQSGTPIMDCKLPTDWAGGIITSDSNPNDARGTKPSNRQELIHLAPVYDITNCGPRHRYMANGKLVHNSDKVNIQNLAKRSKEPVLRRSMRAIADHVILSSDSSQIEARLLAYLADQQDVVQVFVNNQDVYIDMAVKIYNESYGSIYEQSKGPQATKEGKMKRNIAKAVVLGAGYGASAATFAKLMKQQGLAAQADMAADLIATYRTANHRISGFWRECQRILDIMYAGGQEWFGGPNNDIFFADGASEFHGVKIPSIRGPNGTYIFYQNLRKEVVDNSVNYVYDQFKGRGWQPKRIWGSALAENLTQYLAFSVLKYQAIEIAKAGVPVNFNVHDEWVSVVPRAHAAKAIVTHYKAMRATPPYIPDGLLDCEVDVGNNYADLKTVNVAEFL